jgi:hypothetical protein
MKREIACTTLFLLIGTAGMLNWAADLGPADDAPAPARDAFVKAFSANPLGFNGVFVDLLDAETTATAAQKYAVLKTLVKAEAAMSPRAVGQFFVEAPPAVKARLKVTTKAILDQATSATLAQAAIMGAEAEGALGDN